MHEFALSLRRIAGIVCCIPFAAVAGCNSDGSVPDADASAELAEWTVSAEPELQIGVVDGDPDYQLHVLLGTVTLPDGGIAALNAGAHELRVYDAQGRFVSRHGRRGGGPGEFQKPLRVYLLGDTIAVYDEGLSRLSLHRLDGGYIAARPLPRVRGKFALDEWLHDMSWIDGPPLGRGRAAVMSAVERLPPPDTSEGYRYVRVTPHGHLWMRQPMELDASTREWRVYDLNGNAIARVRVPANLEVYEFGPDYLLGRGRDSLQVEYILRHRLDTHGVMLARHEFVEDSTAMAHTSAIQPEALAEIKAALRNLNAAQEIYYSNPKNSYTYADDHRKLQGYETPEAVIVRIVNGHTTGFTAIAMDRATRVMCGVSVGTTPPVGWTPGVVMCL